MNATVTPLRPDQSAQPGDSLTSVQLCEHASITYRQVDYWTRAGYLNTTDGQRHGSGSRNQYSRTEADVARTGKQLLDIGLDLQSSFLYARRVTEHGQRLVFADGLVVIGGQEVTS